ncbi:MAG: TVP38/TMEM64 family protein, partial [bacterium]|nr:TVP38/TMEM64 family protein [bacterium]
LGIVFSILDPQSFSQAQEVWRGRIVAFGLFAPVAFVIVQALQVIITPISHYSVGVIGGFLYGPYLGALLNWIGRMIGHIIAFVIARTFGRRIAERFVKPETLEKYDRYISNKSFVLFILYFLPLFPDDELSYLAGLSKMKFRMFFIANLFGHIGGSLGLAYLGSGINTKDPLFWILTVVTLIGFPLLYWRLKKNKKAVDKGDLPASK